MTPTSNQFDSNRLVLENEAVFPFAFGPERVAVYTTILSIS
jgi:hypothetical protein